MFSLKFLNILQDSCKFAAVPKGASVHNLRTMGLGERFGLSYSRRMDTPIGRFICVACNSILVARKFLLYPKFDLPANLMAQNSKYIQNMATSHHLTATIHPVKATIITHLNYGNSCLISLIWSLFPSICSHHNSQSDLSKSKSDQVPPLPKNLRGFPISLRVKSKSFQRPGRPYITSVSFPLWSQFLLLFSLFILLQSYWVFAVLQTCQVYSHLRAVERAISSTWNCLLQKASMACSFTSSWHDISVRPFLVTKYQADPAPLSPTHTSYLPCFTLTNFTFLHTLNFTYLSLTISPLECKLQENMDIGCFCVLFTSILSTKNTTLHTVGIKSTYALSERMVKSRPCPFKHISDAD